MLSAKDIKELERDIKAYDRIINNNKKDELDKVDAYYMKAKALTKLGKYQDALTCYDRAIVTIPEEQLYWLERAKLYVAIKDFTSAVKDIQRLKELPTPNFDELPVDKKIEALYIRNTLDQLKKSDSSIKQLLNDGKIDQGLAKSLTSNIEAGSDLTLLFKNQSAENKKLTEKLQAVLQRVEVLENKAVLSEQEVTELKTKNDELQDVLNDHDDYIIALQKKTDIHDGLIVDMSAKIDQLSSLSDKIIKLDVELASLGYNDSANLSGMDDNKALIVRIEALEKDRQELQQQVRSVVKTLDTTGIIEEAAIKDKVKALQNKPELHEYYNNMYFQLETYLQVYKELGTGLLSGNSIEVLQTSKYSNIKWFMGVLGKAGFEVVKTCLDSYGVMAALYSVVDDVQSAKDEVAKENQITKINKVIKSKFLKGGELNKNTIAHLALKLTDIREAQIGVTAIEEKDNSLLSHFDGLLGQAKDKMIGKVIERYDSRPEKLAVHDILMLLTYICNRYQKISSTELPISEFFSERMLKEIEISTQLDTSLGEVKDAANKGHWHTGRGKDLRVHKNIEGRLSEDYLREKLGSIYTADNVKIAKQLYFAMINLGIKENGYRDLTCTEEFSKTEPVLLAEIVENHPEYFVGVPIVMQCVNDPVKQSEVIAKLNHNVQVLLLDEIKYDNPLLNNPEALLEISSKYGTKVASMLLNLSEPINHDSEYSIAMTGDISDAAV